MGYKGIRFEIVETTNPCRWKWIVFLTPNSNADGRGAYKGGRSVGRGVRHRRGLGRFQLTDATGPGR